MQNLSCDAVCCRYPKLSDNVDADVCVIGGGVSGLTTAYLLAKAGEILRRLFKDIFVIAHIA